jgi:hypothetical protein
LNSLANMRHHAKELRESTTVWSKTCKNMKKFGLKAY